MQEKIENIEEYTSLALVTDLSPEQYEKAARRLIKNARMEHGLHGLTTELGELVDIFKRHIFYGTDVDSKKAKEEVGDICWYLAIIFDELDQRFGIDGPEVLAANIRKLKTRYAGKFSEEKAITRNLDQEEKSL